MKQILAFVLLLITGYPFAFALSDSELIQSVANVCVSGNHEEDDCKIIIPKEVEIIPNFGIKKEDNEE